MNMYQLGQHFEKDMEKAVANKENVIEGKSYRFTVLTDNLIRLEYNKNGVFQDKPTELVWYRNMEKVPFEKKESPTLLEIKTKYFKLTYVKEKPFIGTKMNPIAHLKVELLNTDRIWYYGHPEARNFGTPGFSLDKTEGKLKLSKGLYSSDGFVAIDDSNSNVMEKNGTVSRRREEEIDIYLFMYGRDFKKCLQDYFKITGSPALIPRYVLGNWWSKNVAYDDNSIRALVGEFKDKEIPLSLLILSDSWYESNYKNQKINSGFTWNQKLFPDPVSLVQYLHSYGVRLGLSINPTLGFYPYENNYATLTKYLKPDSNGIIPFNVYDPRTIDAYFKILINPLDDMNVDFYWIDSEEQNNYNLLWLLNHYQFYNASRNYQKRPVILSKNGQIATHRYPVTYAGKTVVSWESLKMISLFNIASTNIGNNFFAYDVGGYFKGTEDSELYTRFVQLGVFSPILKFGSDKGMFYKREPWKWNFKTYEIAKDYLQLRHNLIPYLYSECYRYHKDGTPLIKPLYFDYPDYYDDDIYKTEYYFGSQMFIAPILRKKDYVMNRVIHKFFLPKGVWFDYETGKKYNGDRAYLGFYKDQDYPCFVRKGAIIPLTYYPEEENINDTTPPKTLEITIFPGMNNSYDLYEDDGVSDLYKKGYYLLTNIEYQYKLNHHLITIKSVEGKTGIVPDKRTYRIKMKNTRTPDDVKVFFNKQPYKYSVYQKSISCIVEVKDVPSVGTLQIEISGNHIDIEAENLVRYDVLSIIQDLQIKTELKEQIYQVLFDEKWDNKRKRIEIRKLESKGLEKKFVNLFLKLLEYLEQV